MQGWEEGISDIGMIDPGCEISWRNAPQKDTHPEGATNLFHHGLRPRRTTLTRVYLHKVGNLRVHRNFLDSFQTWRLPSTSSWSILPLMGTPNTHIIRPWDGSSRKTLPNLWFIYYNLIRTADFPVTSSSPPDNFPILMSEQLHCWYWYVYLCSKIDDVL